MNITLPNRLTQWRRKPTPEASVTVKPVARYVEQSEPIQIPLDDALYSHCLQSSGVIELANLKFQSPAISQLLEAGVALILPLINQGELVGMLQMGQRLSDQEYTSDDQRLLGTLGPQAAAALRVAQLAYQQQVEARRRERMEQELRVAGVIQQTLLPKEVPILANWQIAAYWQPARTVGGDFYDFIYLRDGRIMIIIGDVTDKGIPAALVMASTRSILRSVVEQTSSPGEVLRRANDILFPDMPPKMFVTCLCAILDPQTGVMQYANAGHNPSQQRTQEGLVELRARGMPLGLMPGMYYEEKTTTLAPNDLVLMYSDGLVEAHNPERDMFGMKRLQALLTENLAGDMVTTVLRDALFMFTGAEWEQEDDVTLVVIQRNSLQDNGSGMIKTMSQIMDEFEAPSVVDGERAVMERVANLAQSVGMPIARINRLKTAVAEAVMNAMEHGNEYHPDKMVKIKVIASSHELTVSITDQGTSMMPINIPTPEIEAKLAGIQSARGWGLFLIKAMVDDLRVYASSSSEHTVELIMKIEGANHVNKTV